MPKPLPLVRDFELKQCSQQASFRVEGGVQLLRYTPQIGDSMAAGVGMLIAAC